LACKNCFEKPVFKLISGESLCRSCFLRYFERKVRKTVRIFKLLGKEERIVVGVSGGKDSLTVLNILHNIAERQRKWEVIALAIDEGIKGYRNSCLMDARDFCKTRGITLHVYSFKDEFGYSLDEMVKKLKMKPCSICGVLRRHLLNTKARELGATKLATGHNMDDEAQSIIMNQFRRNIETSARLGPITGVIKEKKFIRRVKPLYLMTEKEVMAYAFLKGISGRFVECPYAYDSYRGEVRDMLNEFEARHPGTKNSIVQSFLEILPLLKKHYKTQAKLKFCRVCGEPCSGEICKACEILEKLGVTGRKNRKNKRKGSKGKIRKNL